MGQAYKVWTPMCQLSRAAFITSIGAQCVKMSPSEPVTCAIEYFYYTIKINVAYQNISFHIWKWQTNERVWQHLLIVTFGSFEKIKVLLITVTQHVMNFIWHHILLPWGLVIALRTYNDLSSSSSHVMIIDHRTEQTKVQKLRYCLWNCNFMLLRHLGAKVLPLARPSSNDTCWFCIKKKLEQNNQNHLD